MVLRQLTKEQVKEEVKKLVDKYNRIVESGSIKGYSENGTKKDFITPLFKALGWDVENEYSDDEVRNEEKISKGRVDYSFRINGIPKFFLEAKALKEDLDNIKFVEQAINYAWHKGCTWAVLTDFEAIKIFNAEWKSTNPLQAQFGQTLPCRLFLEKFDQLWLLSRESFEKKLLDTEAEKWGKKVKKISVDKQLLDDLTKFRDLLNKNILKNNSSKNMSADDLDEAVQRIIDRLIFIRTLEDKELEAPMLQSVIREDLNKRIYKKLNLIFRKIDDIYNSKLFTSHLCESLEIDDEVLSKIINGLFNTSDNTVHYDFSAIDADVLGNIYEQYLGHILKKTDKRAKLAEGKAHRKEQGIYYTPTYVVDYIVKNTVGELAKDKNFDLKNIKILDPACGSGSFLMKAFDYLVTLDKKKNGEIEQTKLDLAGATATYGRKIEILKNNIFGVDLDPKAVEIAQLNLLLKAAEKKHRLPTLQENIKIGNSLIDDKTISPRAFRWEEEFKEIISNGGFDVVIGNPPYGAAFNNNEKIYFEQKYFYMKSIYESYRLFIERAIKLVKKEGYLGLIIPNTWFYLTNAEHMRKELLSKFTLVKIINLPQSVFEDATIDTCILILRNLSQNSNQIKTYFFPYKDKINNLENLKYSMIKQNDLLNAPSSVINLKLTGDDASLISKIKKQPLVLNDYVKIITGIKPYQVGKGIPSQTKKILDEKPYTSTTQKDGSFKPWLTGKFISRYGLLPNKEFIKYGEWLAEPKTAVIFETDRIVLQQIRNPSLPRRIVATFIKGGIYTNNGIHNLLIKDKKQSLWILGILNSKLMNFYFSAHYNDVNIKPSNLYNLPYPQYAPNSKIITLVSQILSLNDKLDKIRNKQTDQKAQLEKEIQKLDSEIDEEVYKLYGITEGEKKIIEESLK